MGFDDIQWLPIALGLTALGVLLTWTVGRRRGAAAVLRGLAWSLVPVALYLTGTIEALWRMGSALVNWATGFVFNIQTWVGVGVAGLAFLLFLISRFLRVRAGGTPSGRKQARQAKGSGESGPPAVADRTPTRQLPASQPQAGSAGADDDFSDIEELLRRRGIS